MNGIAHAMGQVGGASAPQGGAFGPFIPLIIMFVIFYFLLIRPQQKKAKLQQEMIGNLKKGDKVITTGGICGVITAIKENFATVEIAENVKIKVVRQHLILEEKPAPAVKKKDKESKK